MSEAIEDGLFLDAIRRLDKAAQYADIDDESLEPAPASGNDAANCAESLYVAISLLFPYSPGSLDSLSDQTNVKA